jgi:hypothetical protein
MKNFDHLRAKVAELEARLPQAYVLLDANGEELLHSDLDALEWFNDCLHVFNDPARSREAEELREKLSRTASSKGGDKIFEVIAALAHGPIETSASVHSRIQDSRGTACREGSQA